MVCLSYANGQFAGFYRDSFQSSTVEEILVTTRGRLGTAS